MFFKEVYGIERSGGGAPVARRPVRKDIAEQTGLKEVPVVTRGCMRFMELKKVEIENQSSPGEL
jgi:hypothetical protein